MPMALQMFKEYILRYINKLCLYLSLSNGKCNGVRFLWYILWYNTVSKNQNKGRCRTFIPIAKIVELIENPVLSEHIEETYFCGTIIAELINGWKIYLFWFTYNESWHIELHMAFIGLLSPKSQIHSHLFGLPKFHTLS